MLRRYRGSFVVTMLGLSFVVISNAQQQNTATQKKLFLFIGLPGSGKTTVSKNIAEKHAQQMVHQSVGDLLRAEAKNNTERGAIVAEHLSQGKLVPFRITLTLLAEFFAQNEKPIILLDGYQGPISIIEPLHEVFQQHNVKLVKAISLDIPMAVALERCKARMREDDTPQALATRMQFRHETLVAMHEWHHERAELVRIDAARALDDVIADAEDLLFGEVNQGSRNSNMTPQELMRLKEQAKKFLDILEKEEYQVITTQLSIFHEFEKLLASIHQIPVDTLEKETALCFARALSKGANIYRRIASEKSLQTALEYHQKVIEIRKQYMDTTHTELAHAIADLGATYNELKGAENNEKAITCYQQAIAIYGAHHEANKRYIASTLHKLGNALRDLDAKNTRQAIECLDWALDLFDQLPDDKFTQLERGKILYNQGVNHHGLATETDMKKAIEYLEKARTVFADNNDSARLAKTLDYLGYILSECSDEKVIFAIDYLNQALTIQERLFGSEHVDIATTLHHLAMAHYALHKIDDLNLAIQYLKRALAMLQKLLSENHLLTAKTLADLEKCYAKAL